MHVRATGFINRPVALTVAFGQDLVAKGRTQHTQMTVLKSVWFIPGKGYTPAAVLK